MQIISYDAAESLLVVELQGIPRYEVFDLPASVYEALHTAASPKNYFYKTIWGSRFEHNRYWPNLTALLEDLAENQLFQEIPLNVRSTEADGTTPLHIACGWGDISAVDLLIAAGAPIHAKGDMGTTPIYDAVSFNHVRCVARLLQAGATIDDKNGMGWTAREMATYRGQSKVLGLFSQRW